MGSMTQPVVPTTLTSTMLSSPLATWATLWARSTGSSRTHGVTHGEMVATLSLPVTRAICVVLLLMPLLQRDHASLLRSHKKMDYDIRELTKKKILKKKKKKKKS